LVVGQSDGAVVGEVDVHGGGGGGIGGGGGGEVEQNRLAELQLWRRSWEVQEAERAAGISLIQIGHAEVGRCTRGQRE
jgi:hypothetical protein